MPRRPQRSLTPTTPDLADIDGLGSFRDPAKIHKLAFKVDVLTVDVVRIGMDLLEEVEEHPWAHLAPLTIMTIQEKFRQNVRLQSHPLPISPFLDAMSRSRRFT